LFLIKTLSNTSILPASQLQNAATDDVTNQVTHRAINTRV